MHNHDQQREEPEPQSLDERTKVPIKFTFGIVALVLGLVSAICACTWFLGTTLTEIRMGVDQVRNSLNGLKGDAENLKVEVALLKKQFADEVANVKQTVSTEVSNMKQTLSTHEREDDKNWTMLKSQFDSLEKSGSQKALQVEQDVNRLRSDFEVHKAMEKKETH